MTPELPLLRVLSLGAGVQSSALYLMAVHGEFPGETPDLAIFADTQWEPPATYAWLDELERIGGSKIPIQRVTRGSLRQDVIDGVRTGKRIPNLPYFTEDPKNPKRGMLMRRTCTYDYKITPLQRATRAALNARRVELGVRGKLKVGEVEKWIGISTDEASRMKDSGCGYVTHRWPLIEKQMSRHSCIEWMRGNGYPEPPKSACIGCPFHNATYWRAMRDERPSDWEDATEFDDFLRAEGGGENGVMRGMKSGGSAYLNRNLVPLRSVDFRTESEKSGQINLFENECEGMCGV